MSEERFLETRFGTLAYVEVGVGPAVLFLHSLGSSKRLWRSVLPALGLDARALALDFLGHGSSDEPRHDLTISGHADSVVEFMGEAEIDQCALVGTSLGALIGLEIAARHPRMVDTLILNGCPGWHLECQRMGRLAELAEMMGPDGLPREECVPKLAIRGTCLKPDRRELQERMSDITRAGRWYLSSMWAIACFDPMSRLDLIRQPTLILMGSRDYHMATSYVLVEGISSARLCVIPDAGHLTPYDAPEGVAAAIRAHVLADLREGPTPSRFRHSEAI